jgi:hypothetical protein
MVKGEPFVKYAREGDDVVPVVKDNDAVPVVNQDEAPVDPFGDRDDWAIGIMSKAFLKIRHVLQNTCRGTLKPPRDEKVNSYVFIFTIPLMSWKNYQPT